MQNISTVLQIAIEKMAKGTPCTEMRHKRDMPDNSFVVFFDKNDRNNFMDQAGKMIAYLVSKQRPFLWHLDETGNKNFVQLYWYMIPTHPGST